MRCELLFSQGACTGPRLARHTVHQQVLLRDRPDDRPGSPDEVKAARLGPLAALTPEADHEEVSAGRHGLAGEVTIPAVQLVRSDEHFRAVAIEDLEGDQFVESIGIADDVALIGAVAVGCEGVGHRQLGAVQLGGIDHGDDQRIPGDTAAIVEIHIIGRGLLRPQDRAADGRVADAETGQPAEPVGTVGARHHLHFAAQVDRRIAVKYLVMRPEEPLYFEVGKITVVEAEVFQVSAEPDIRRAYTGAGADLKLAIVAQVDGHGGAHLPQQYTVGVEAYRRADTGKQDSVPAAVIGQPGCHPQCIGSGFGQFDMNIPGGGIVFDAEAVFAQAGFALGDQYHLACVADRPEIEADGEGQTGKQLFDVAGILEPYKLCVAVEKEGIALQTAVALCCYTGDHTGVVAGDVFNEAIPEIQVADQPFLGGAHERQGHE